MITIEDLIQRKGDSSGESDHEHDLEDREFNVEGYTVSGKVCTVCGERFFLLKDLLPLERELRRRETGSEPLSVDDAVLLLAGTYPSVEIPGNVVLQKEMFLLEKSFAPEYRLNLQPLEFVPYRLGPYSKKVKRAVERLRREGVLERRPLLGRVGFAYILSDVGRRLVEEKRTLIAPGVWRKLRERRRAWDELGSRGLLRLVYKDFSPYASESEIRENVERERRED